MAGAEVLSAETLPAQACPPPPAGRGLWQPEGQRQAHTPCSCQQLGPEEEEVGKRRRQSSPRGRWESSIAGRGQEEETLGR